MSAQPIAVEREPIQGAVRDRPAPIGNAAFLREVFRGFDPKRERLHVCGFKGEPNPAAAWAGRAYFGDGDPVPTAQNTYFSIATFRLPAADEKASRSKAQFSACHVIVVDDAKDVPLLPSYVLQTGPVSFQAGFLLDKPCSDIARVDRIMAALSNSGHLGGDRSGNNAVRYVRLPCGQNEKAKYGEPFPHELLEWNPSRRYAIEAIESAFLGNANPADTASRTPSGADSRGLSFEDFVTAVAAGESYHDPLNRIAASLVGKGIDGGAVAAILRGLMRVSAGKDADPDRWKARFDDIDRSVATAVKKFAPKTDGSADAGKASGDGDADRPVDIFATIPAPGLPLDAMPGAIQEFARANAQSTGYDAGAYAFAALIAASAVIDHRSRIAVAGGFDQPPVLWGLLLGDSGDGKSPILKPAAAPVRDISDGLMRSSSSALAQYNQAVRELKRGDPLPERPPWHQIVTQDTTIEALGQLLSENPAGVMLFADELSEWLGSMDAYVGAGRDRAAYLRAFGAESHSINRKSGNLFVPSFSVAVLGGIQPGMVAEAFNRRGGSGADGLLQRFVVYSPAPAGPVTYADISPCVTHNFKELYRRLFDWTQAGVFQQHGARLCPEAVEAMREHHNRLRTLQTTMPRGRFAEHISKLAGILARVAYVLHALECAEMAEYAPGVSLGTFQRAQRLLRVLLRHSEAMYRIVDQGDSNTLALARAAAEAILAKRWTWFTWSHLTRDATGWRGADRAQRDAAVDMLIEFGWIQDVTLEAQRLGARTGRPADGRFAVPHAVHQTFAEHARRIGETRAARLEALKATAAARAEGVS